MGLWRESRSNRAKANLESGMSQEIIHDPLLLDCVKTENYLAVALGIRSCSFVTIPAEFPGGYELGRKIDELCVEDLQAVMSADAAEKQALMKRLKERIQEAFRKVVLSSDVYKAHIKWSKQLFLKTYNVEVRPSICELYLFRESRIKKALEKLMRVRESEREKLRLGRDVKRKKVNLAYAEEMSSEYLSSLGRLLGYPFCCVRSYINDRLNEDMTVEIRSSRQIEGLGNQLEDPEIHAFFAKDFFPCKPECQKAIRIGKSIFDNLNALDPKLGDLYLGCVRRNVEMVRRYPQLIEQHKKNLNKRTREFADMVHGLKT